MSVASLAHLVPNRRYRIDFPHLDTHGVAVFHGIERYRIGREEIRVARFRWVDQESVAHHLDGTRWAFLEQVQIDNGAVVISTG